jgi:hypothetical protein
MRTSVAAVTAFAGSLLLGPALIVGTVTLPEIGECETDVERSSPQFVGLDTAEERCSPLLLH